MSKVWSPPVGLRRPSQPTACAGGKPKLKTLCVNIFPNWGGRLTGLCSGTVRCSPAQRVWTRRRTHSGPGWGHDGGRTEKVGGAWGCGPGKSRGTHQQVHQRQDHTPGGPVGHASPWVPLCLWTWKYLLPAHRVSLVLKGGHGESRQPSLPGPPDPPAPRTSSTGLLPSWQTHR